MNNFLGTSQASSAAVRTAAGLGAVDQESFRKAIKRLHEGSLCLALSPESARHAPFKSRFGTVANKPSITQREDVVSLAKECGLVAREIPAKNAHLAMTDGDISYWFDRTRPGGIVHVHYRGPLTPAQLAIEFGTRRIVLELAQRFDMLIPTQEDLSWFSEALRDQALRPLSSLLLGSISRLSSDE